MPPSGPTLTQTSTNEALRDISQMCPQLQNLQIFPFQIINFFSDAHSTPYEVYVSAFRQLRTLTTSLTMLRPEHFLALSQLPYLQSLAVFSSGAEPLFTTIDIPEASFLALRQLAVHDLRPPCIEALWGVSSLVTRLTQVTVQTSFIGSDEPWLNIARIISNRTPLLAELHLDFGHGYTPLLSNFISHFHQTYLTALIIGGQPQLWTNFPEFVLGLPSRLEVLKIRGEKTPVKFLAHLARHLPHLRLLALDLFMHEAPADEVTGVTAQAVNAGREQVGRFVLQSSWAGLTFASPMRKESIAWSLHMLWPNTTCEFFPDMDRTAWEKQTKDENRVALWELNRQLGLLRIGTLTTGSWEVISAVKL
ncbi:hypothetical protein FRC10_003027 [Ceratobasidium sp. 414]|nr:hypothetical protein FRC10_003027 [Ceratobasidium sp. 414]